MLFLDKTLVVIEADMLVIGEMGCDIWEVVVTGG